MGPFFVLANKSFTHHQIPFNCKTRLNDTYQHSTEPFICDVRSCLCELMASNPKKGFSVGAEEWQVVLDEWGRCDCVYVTGNQEKNICIPSASAAEGLQLCVCGTWKPYPQVYNQ